MAKWDNLGDPLKDSAEVSADASGAGKTYRYRVLAATAAANLPLVGEDWEDGRAVASATWKQNIDNSGYDEIELSTRASFDSTSQVETSKKYEAEGEEPIQVVFVQHQVPLTQHPAFIPGGTYDLFATATYPWQYVMGWEMEQNPVYKAQRKYRELDSEGYPSGTVTTISNGSALAYIKLRQMGFDTCTVWLPEVTKISRYKGTTPPSTESRGEYIAHATVEALGPHVPRGFQWIKSADDVNPTAGRNPWKWERREVWNGFAKVYFDKDTINPASNTLP